MSADIAGLWDWRRRIADLYAAIRADPDPARAHDLWQTTRRRLFATHSQSPLPAGERGAAVVPHVYPYDPAWRLAATLVPLDPVSRWTFEAGADGTIALTDFARTDGLAERLGGELTLSWIGGYGGGVFLSFADATSGRTTYGGGRYLLDTIKSADLGTDGEGRLALDFNFAYPPSCAYAPEYVCPLPPPGNRVTAAITAGERLAG